MSTSMKSLILEDIEMIKTADIPMISAREHYSCIFIYVLKATLLVIVANTTISFMYGLIGVHMSGKLIGTDHFRVPIIDGFTFGLIPAAVFALFIFPSIFSKYVIFKKSYYPILKSGKQIDATIKQFGKTMFIFYFGCVFISGWIGYGIMVIGNAIAFFLSLFFVNFIVSSTFDRIGIPNLSDVIRKITGG